MNKIAVVTGLTIVLVGLSYYTGIPVLTILSGIIQMVQYAINSL